MKVNYKVGNLTVEFESDTVREVFTQLSSFQEVFGEIKCGKCGSDNLRFVVRENEGNEYYEIRCQDCGAKLAFGSHKKGGGLFPRRKDVDGNWLPDHGWQKWNPKTKSVE
tara:strand:+ start:114 stop:443 length:330 start_codon:yes stop_codon:yes gene_type:complete